MAEQIGSTFAQACIIDKKGQHKHPVPVPVHVTHSRNDYAPMELGAAKTFAGNVTYVAGLAIRPRHAPRVNRHLPTPVPTVTMVKASSRPNLITWNKQ